MIKVCIAFDGAGSLSFGNDFARNVVIFAIDNSSSSHAEKIQKYFFSIM